MSPALLAFCGMVLLALPVLRSLPQRAAGDPDRFFHFAVSRLSTEQGLLRTLPQVRGLGWEEYFPDKEFLFHVVTTAAYRVGADDGVIWACALLSAMALGLIAWFLSQRLPVASSISLVAATTLTCPSFLFRLQLVRPHVFAIACFVALCLGVLRRSRLATSLAACAFVLGYHAFYIPIAALVVGWVLGGWCRDQSLQRVAQWGLVGVLVGIVSNPYFPSTLLMSARHLAIAVHGSAPGGGNELGPMSVGGWFLRFGFFAAALVVTAWTQRADLGRRDHSDLSWLWLISAGLWLASWSSARASEYAIPATVLLIGVTVARTAQPRLLTALVAVAALVVQVQTLVAHVRRGSNNFAVQALRAEAAQRLPADAAQGLVLNSSWALSPHLLYQRPDVAFLDILDPSFLVAHNPELAKLRAGFARGELADPASFARSLDARYVVCDDPPALEQLGHDPHFGEVWRGDSPFGYSIGVYRVAPEPDPHFLTSLRIDGQWREVSEPFVDLGAKGGCVRVEWVEGSGDWLGVGGFGAGLTVLDGNNQVMLSTHPRVPRLVHRLVPLARAKVVEVCGDGEARAVALSIWSTVALPGPLLDTCHASRECEQTLFPKTR